MQTFIKTTLLGSLFALALSSSSYAFECTGQFAGGAMPQMNANAYAKKMTNLCFSEYALLYSGATRTPLWTSEHLTRERITAGKSLSREDNFHEESALPVQDRATLSDYKGSMKVNLQRGHMAPNKDFSMRNSQYESFSLSNIIPQNGNNNEQLWNEIEQKVRGMTMQRGQLFVVTGPVFDGSTNLLNGRVVIPKRLFKAVYDPAKNEAGAYLTSNGPGWEYRIISIAELESIVGFNVFPSLSATIKNRVANFALPKEHVKKENNLFSFFH